MAFDVAGVRLGATPSQAKAALLKAGYVIAHAHTTPSFEELVRFEADRRLGRNSPFARETGTDRIIANGPNREYLEAAFIQSAGGSVVGVITVSIPADAITTADLRAQLASKYGRPDAARFNGSEQTWCAAQSKAFCGQLVNFNGPLDTAFPRLKATAGSGGRIVLQIGHAFEEQVGREREAAVERLAPKTRRGAF